MTRGLWRCCILVTMVSLTGCAAQSTNIYATVTAQAERIAQLEATSQPTATSEPTMPPIQPTPSPVPTPSTAEIMAGVSSSVVRIIGKDSEGSGFVLYKPGHVLTAFHVVSSTDAVLSVVGSDGTTYRGMVLGADEQRDLALLSIPGITAQPLKIAAAALPGDPVLAVGYAAGLDGEPTVTRGIVSARRVDAKSGIEYVQTDAPINPGGSGGPLLNERGEVVGINVSRLEGALQDLENMGFAISFKELGEQASSLQSGEVRMLPTPTSPPTRTPTSFPTASWCTFLTKARATQNAREAATQLWNDHNARMPRFEGDPNAFFSASQVWFDEYDAVVEAIRSARQSACSLPRDFAEARPIADKLCASADAMLTFAVSGADLEYDSYRIQSNLYSTQAQDMLEDLQQALGYPQCP